MQIIEANPQLMIVSAIALIAADGRVLLAQRPEGKHWAGFWEFPGGKVERNETPETALIREVKEELSIDITESCLAPLNFASYSYERKPNNPAFNLLLLLFICRRWCGIPRPVEGGVIKWVSKRALANFPMPPADKPLISTLQDLL